MPSYRYLRDIEPEELQPEKPPEYTKKQKRKNWWQYNWKWVALGLALVLVAVFLVRDVAGAVKPDVSIGIVQPGTLPDEVVEKLEQALAELAGDWNEDGKTAASIEQYTITPYAGEDDSQPADPYAQMAGTTQLAAALGSTQPAIFIVSPAEIDYYQEIYELFGLPNGEAAPQGADPFELTVAFEDCPVFAGIDLSYIDYEGKVANGQDLLRGYRVGLRPLQDPAMDKEETWPDVWEQNRQFYLQLTAGS